MFCGLKYILLIFHNGVECFIVSLSHCVIVYSKPEMLGHQKAIKSQFFSL